MSSTLTNTAPKRDNMHLGSSNLSREKIQQLLAAAGSKPTEDTTEIETTEYNWHQPHYFNSAQHNKLGDFAKKVAKAISQKVSTLCHQDFNVTVSSTTEHFAHELIDQILSSKEDDYYLAFGTSQEQRSVPRMRENTISTPSRTENNALGVLYPRGLISIPVQTAITWVTQLLGDSESERDSSSDLSQLEESLLLDIAKTIVEALSKSHINYDFRLAEAMVRGQLPLELRGMEELCKIAFSFEKADSENPDTMGEAHLLIFCDQLEPVVGRTAQAASGFSAEDTSKAILEHLQQMPVSVTAQLDFTFLTLEEIINLRPCDILLLDKRIDEPIELIVEGRTILSGHIAKSAGRYAVVITGDTKGASSCLKTPEPPHNTS